MNDFLFDLQRFVDGGTITVASDGTANTITIPADGTTSTSTEYTFSISGEGIDTKTYSITLGASSAAEISADSTGKVILNVTAGTASSLIYTNYTGDYITNRVPVILLGGNLYLNNFGNPQPVTLDENGPTINLRSSFSDRSTLVKYNSDNKQVEINCSNHTNDPLYLYIGYFTYNLPADLTLNRIYNEETEENKISFALPTQRNSFTYSYTDSTSGLPVSETFSTSGTVNIVADNNNAIYLSDLVNGETFTITKTFNGTTTTTTYTMYNKKLVAEREVDSKKVHKRWTGPDIESTTDVAWSDLDFDSSESLLGDILDIEGSDLTVTSDTLLAANWDGVSTKLIVDSEFKDSAYFDTNNNNITPAYGTLVRESATSFRVELNDAIKNLTSITIGEGLTAKIDSSYTIPITVNTTTFRSLDSLSSDMLSIAAAGNTGTISVGGSESISLGSGSLHTADEDQTVSTSNYTVSSYGHSGTSEDGIIISAESVIGDVDYGESFKVETDAKTSNYTLLSSGIGLLEYRTTGNSSDYYLHSGLGTPTESTGISVNLNSVNGGALIIMPDNNGLDIGGTNTQTAVVFNSKENPTTGYASLYADGDGNYTLSPLDGTFSNGVNKISLMGGSKNKSTTIYKSLVNSGNVTLTAYDSTVSTPTVAATFLVTGASGDTFTVNNITSTPTIENATNITLISGSITVQKNQTIKLGVSGNDLVLSDDLTSTATVTYGSSGWTIAFADGVTGGFTYGGKYYKVGGGDGISFVLSDASVTIDSLNNGDVFYYGNTSINNDIYSVKGAGFIRGSSSNVSLWTNKDSVIPAVSLDSADWKPIITVDSANRLTIPSSITTTARTIIDTEYTTTYGNVQKAGSVYQLDRSSDDSGTLSLISLESNINNISLHGADSSHNFLNVSIFGANTSLKVTEATDNTYEVTLSTDNTHLSGATAAELLRGSLTASSLITGGVVVDGSTVIAASNQEVTLITDSSGSEASIAGIAKNEAFNLDNRNYTLTGAGLLRDDAKLLRRTEEVVYDENINTRKISDILVADSWLGMTAPGSSDSVLTIGNAIQNSLYVVNDTVSPASLFGEVSRESAGSYSLTADGIVDAWNPNYTINLNSVTLSVSSNFKDGKFTGTNSGAAFTVDSLSGNSFVAADRATSSGGASLSGVSKLTQTAGLITGEGINSITVGDKTIHNSSGLPLNVSVSSGSNATLSGLASGEAFSIGNDAYSVNAIGIIANDSLFFKDNSLQPESAALSKLATDSGSWVCIATIENDTLFSVPPTTGDDEWIVLDSAKTTPYATVTKIDDNNYSMDSLQNAWGDATIKVGDGKTLSLSNAFANETISVESGGALFTVRENSAYTVTDSVSANAASIGGGAKTINQTAGTIAINSSEQSIIAGGHSISGAGSDVMVVVSNGNAAVGGLASSEEFTVDGITYRLLSNGRLQRENDDAIWSGTLIATNNSGSVNASDLSLTSNWYGAVKTDSAGKLTIDSVVSNVFTADSVTSALVVNETLHTIIYGTMIHGVNDTLYALNANDSTAPINSIEFTTAVSHVSLTSNFTNVSLTAGDNNFSVRSADDGFTVNYTSSALSVDDASVVDLSNGKMLLDKSNQTITAGGQSVMGASESVNVNYSGSTVVVDDIASAGESLKIGTHTYSLGSGDFDVSIISGNATVGKITSGDKFQIDDATFEYTAAGLTKNNSLGSYLLKSTFPTGNQLALDSLLGTEAWLGTHSVANDVISITSDMGSVILVDNVSNPTKNYGWIDYENSTHTLAKDTNANANPTLIAVGDSVTASISSDFSNVSVTSSNATNIFVTDSASGNHTISGTINRFLPSTMIFTPQAPNDSVSGDVFTVDGENYEMKGAGLTKPKDDLIWTEEVSSYSLPSDDAWSNMISLTSAGVLDFKTEDATDGFNVIVDSDLSTRQGTLTYDSATSSYALTSSGDSISSIQTDDGDASFTTNFATKFITGNGTQSINGKAYTGNNLEIDATTRTSTLTKGTVTIASGAQAVTPTNDTTAAVSVTGGDSITATAAEGKWTSLGALNDGDTFAIKGTTYKVYGSNTLVKLDSSNDPTEIYNPSITGGAISYDSLVGDDYSSIIKLNSSNQLNLRGNPSITSAIVVGQTGGNFDPTNRIAALEYSDGTYSLSTTPGGVVSNMNAVLLGTAVKTFNTDQETTVITSGSTTFNVNNNSFVAQNALTIATKDSKATLTNGTITLSKDATVNTRYNGIDETITETNGEITVNVSNSAVRLSGIDTSDAFTVGNVTYTMTNVGLADSNKKLNYAMLSNGSITTASLSGGSWKDILEAPDGVLTINDSVSATDAYVAYVDTTNPGTAVKYGTLTQAGGTYTLTQNDDNDTVLSSINISGVKAVLPLRCTDTSIVTDNAQIKVSADAPFTIDDTGETLAISNVTAISLESGELQAVSGVPITANGNVITTSDTITVGIDSTGVYVGDLNADETFTVGETGYKMTSAGLLDTTNKRLATDVTEKYYLGNATFTAIIAADGSTLHLENQTTSAAVYDDLSNPTTHMATLEVKSGKLTLTEENGGIDTIELGEGKTFETDITATVNASGTTTVNGKKYVGTGDLTIDTVGDVTNSTLQKGTITLSSGNSARATSDDTDLTVTSGTISATASAGHFTEISELDAGDTFTFDGKTYTQSTIGLLTTGDGSTIINTSVESNATVTNLNNESNWQKILTAPGGELTIDSESGNVLAADVSDATAAVRYGTLTNNRLTLSANDTTPTSVTVADGVKVTLPEACENSTLTAKGVQFSVVASGDFTLDATADVLTMSGGIEEITLTSGELQAVSGVPITANGNVITTSDTMTVGIDSTGVYVGDLNADETFTVGETGYKMTSAGLLDTTNKRLATDVTEKYYLGNATFAPIIAADGSTLHLENQTTSAAVYDDLSNPTTHMATLEVKSGKLTLTEENGGIDTIELGEGKTFETDITATVNASGTTTVNGKKYVGTGDLTIDTVGDVTNSTLQKGTITLTSGTSARATSDDTDLTVTSGTISATASAGKFTKIEELDAGDTFTFNGKTYTQSTIGLLTTGDGSTIINTSVESDVTVTNLNNESNWQKILTAPGGELTIDSDSGNVLAADVSDATAAVRYGTLTNNRLTLSANDTTPTSVTVADGVKVTLPEACENSTLTAKGVQFSVVASGDFTLDATADVLTMSGGIEEITLTSGELQAVSGVPITANGNVITTSDTITVGIDSTGVYVGDLNADETFTVGETGYKMTSAGLLDTTNSRLATDVTEKYYLGNATFAPIIAADGSTLNLENQTTSAAVYDDLSNPTTHMATLEVKSGKLTLTEENGGIDTIELGEGKTFETDITATVNASGTTTVNGKKYVGTGDLTIDTVGDVTNSTLQKGTITLSSGNSARATSDNTDLTVTSGTISATASAGKFTKIEELDAGDTFTFNGKTYTQSEVGLINDATISEELAGETLDTAKLSNSAIKWSNFIAPRGGVLDVSNETVDKLVLNDTTTPTKKLADLIVSDELTSLKGTSNATDIDSVTVAEGSTLNVDFATKVNAPSGTVTVNSQKYNAAAEIKIDSDGTTSTLYTGTVNLDDTNYPTVTATNDSSNLKVESGSVTVRAFEGEFVSIGDLDSGESFTFNGKTYTQSAVGLMNEEGEISEVLTGKTISIIDLNSAAWSNIIAPEDGTLDLKAVTTDAIVCDDISNPTERLAAFNFADGTLKDKGNAADTIKFADIADGASLTVDFATQVNAPIGTVTVNTKPYNGTTKLLIDANADGKTSTLTDGTVSLAKDDSVSTTTGNKIMLSDGDGITVTVSGETVTVNGLNTGDIFKVDDNTYKIATGGLINTSGKFWTGKENYSDGLTLDALGLASNWMTAVVAKDGALTVNDNTLANGDTSKIVDDLENPTKTFGTLTRDDDGKYSLKKDEDNALASITVDGVKIDIANDLADVPLTIINSDGTKTVLAAKTSEKYTAFTIDATGNSPIVDNMNSIELSSGKFNLLDGQTLTLAEDFGNVEVTAGNGTFTVGNETFTIAELSDEAKVEFKFDTSGEVETVNGFEENSTATIDGITYTAPEDKAILHYTDVDGWYFDGNPYDEYTVTVDGSGNVLVPAGVKFRDVVSSGNTLAEDGTIKFAANLFKTPVTVINENATALKINDANDYTWAENFGKNSKAKFTGDGVEAESLADVAGTTFNLQGTNTITAGDTKITANADDSPVGIGSGGKSISLEKSAKVEAPADINLTLNAAPYEVNGVDFTASGTTSAVTTDNGVKLDLAASESITYDGMTLNSGTGMATMDNEDNITLTGGAVVTNATNRAVYVDGTVILDDKTINTTQTTKVTETTNGFDTEKRNVTVTGDDDGYTINLANDDVRGLEKIGNSNGVTVDGLYTSTVKTDKAGSFTTNDKTFIYSNDAVTYGFRNGSLSAIDSVNSVIGDFIDNIAVNGDPIKVVGESDEPVTVLGDRRSVDKVEVNSAGVFEVSGKTYEILDDDSFAFDMSKGKVTGIESLESGSLVISQKESGFNVNDEKITLSGNTSPVTLGIDDSEISSVSGLDGTINGLKNATVYDLTSAVINDKLIDVSNTDDFDVIVSGGKAKEISGITDGATVNSAPEMTIGAENGTFTFVNDEYTLNDTLDAVFDFLTDENSRVRGLDNFSGSVSGSFDGFTINGKTLNLADQNVTVETDGENITNIIGLKSGGSIDGEIGDTSLVIPEGEITINGTGFKLEGDEDGATLSGNGSVISGLDKDATLSIDKSGTYTIDGKSFDIQAGDSITANRDGAYKIDPKDPPITEKTDAEDILARGDNPVYIDSTSSGASAVDLSGDNDLALIDSPDARVTVTTGEGTDTVVVRHNADVTVDLDEDGGTLIIPTKGNVTLENYDGDNASVKTYEYSNIVGAVKSNEIKFGDGTMTLGDAIVTFDPEAGNIGSTTANLVNAHGEKQPVAFTHDGGGTIDTSDSTENYLIKGNYAESTDDTQKSGGSSIVAGIGNDTILAGAGDYVDAGNGSNQIYLTDRDLRRSVSEGATILLGDNGSDTVHNFSSGFDGGDDQILIKDLSALAFDYGAADLVMKSGNAQITFDSPTNDNETAYEIKLTDGTNEYNAAIAKENETIQVGDDSAANVFFGNEKGISFSEFTGSVEVNLNEATGNLNGRTAQFFGIDKVEAGAGNSSLIGAADTPNTLIAGTGNSSIWSNSGKDLMVGNTSEDKNGSTTFFYEPGDGRDTIQNFDFMTGTTDVTADYVQFDDFSGVTEVLLRGDDVVIGINNSKDDYLTIVDAKGKSFHVNDDLIAKVDAPLVEYDGFTNCYVGIGNNVTMSVGAGMGDVAIWLSDDLLEYHGIRYDGDFRTIDASQATGNNTLAGNEFDNLIIGGAGSNSIWGGYASSNDTLVGGAGQNTFFFALENGHDVIQGAHDGDVVSLEDIFYDNIVRADVTDGGTFIELNDGSSLEIQSTANIDYRLQDGSTYTVDRTNREFVQK